MTTLGSQVSIVMMVCNEEYWIDLVLRPVLAQQIPLYVADCASQDSTPNIISALQGQVKDSYSHQFYYVHHEKITPEENGLVRQDLARLVETPWILQIDGDELWAAVKLEDVLATDMDDYPHIVTGFAHVHNVIWRDSQFILANGISQHRLHRKDAKWVGEYPFESTVDFGNKALYFEGGPHAYHARYLERSSLDKQTYMRVVKQKYFNPDNKNSWNKPVDLFSELGLPDYENPYVRKAKRYNV